MPILKCDNKNYENFNAAPIVRTESGLVRGEKLLTLYENKEYYAFKGIPYAAPPINELRFKVESINNY